MTEELVLIRIFENPDDADDAQAELLAAGIYSLLVSDEGQVPVPNLPQAIGLAVHRRDADVAGALLGPDPRPT